MIMKTKLYTKVNILLLINALFLLSGCAFHVNHETALLENGTKAAVSEAASKTDTAESLKAQNSFSPFISNSTEEQYKVNGTIYLSSKRTLTMLEATNDTEITIKGKLEKVEGDIQLLYKDSDGNITVLADSQESTEDSVSIDTILSAKAGTGEIYFAGASSIYKFDLAFGLSETVKYYMHNDESTASMLPNFEIEMEMTENYDDTQPFINERLFYATDNIDTLEFNFVFQMRGESGLLEIADNSTNEVLWSKSWDGTVTNTAFAAQLKDLQKDKEYVIRFTGTNIKYVNIVAASESSFIKERTRPLNQTTEEKNT